MSKTIPYPYELSAEMPLDGASRRFILESRKSIQNILSGKDPRFLLIVGPCSIHDIDSTLEYANAFRRLSSQLSDLFFLVMRVYVEKPRTVKGWKGFLYDPLLDGSHDLPTGLRLCRKLFLALTEMEIPIGSELLEMITAPYFTELLSWGCIGARTSASPPHRQFASSLQFPVGFKNTTEGNVDTPINAIVAASVPHTFLGVNSQGMLVPVSSSGNPDCHLILRGGENGPNYHRSFVANALEKLQRAKIRKKLLVDCSHDNCQKIAEKQLFAFHDVLNQILDGNQNIGGMMLESHLNGGSQSLVRSDLQYGVSVTDPCLSWEKTEILLLEAYEKAQKASFSLL